jgi:hypothetical protein
MNPVRNVGPKNQSWMEALVTASNSQTESWTEYNRTLIYGEFGVGKTRFCDVPGVFFIDFDDGMTTVRKAGKIPPAVQFRQDTPKVYEKTMSVIEDLRSQRGPFAKGGELEGTRMVALDGVTAMAEAFLYEISQDAMSASEEYTSFKPQFDEWGILLKRLSSVIEGLKQIPYHVIVTAMAKITQDEATKAFVGEIDILGSYRNVIGRRFDEVYYVEKRRARGEELKAAEIANDFYTAYHPRFKVKSRLAASGKIENKIPNPTWDTLIKPLYAKQGGHE